jgi:hypothetical protein
MFKCIAERHGRNFDWLSEVIEAWQELCEAAWLGVAGRNYSGAFLLPQWRLLTVKATLFKRH